MSASEIAFEDWSSSMPRGWPPHRANELRFQDCTCAKGKPSWHKGCLELCEARNITPGSWRYVARPANHLPCRTPALSCHSQCRGGTSGPRGMYRSNRTGIQRSPCIAPGHAIPENPPANALGKTRRFYQGLPQKESDNVLSTWSGADTKTGQHGAVDISSE